MGASSSIPAKTFLEQALSQFHADPRVLGVLVAGSGIEERWDTHSDLDLVLVYGDDVYDAVMASRERVAKGLGSLLTAFTGEHVGEPRLLICLYGEPLVHVDLKFVTLDALAHRVETPRVVFDRNGRVTAALAAGVARWPERTPQWFEDRAWTWLHYGATKTARGEFFEAMETLSFFRLQVLGPMASRNAGAIQRGVRQIERCASADVPALLATVASHAKQDCWRALRAAALAYGRLREGAPPECPRAEAEAAVTRFLELGGDDA